MPLRDREGYWVRVDFGGVGVEETMTVARYRAFCRALDTEINVFGHKLSLLKYGFGPRTPFPIRTIRSLKEYFRGLL